MRIRKALPLRSHAIALPLIAGLLALAGCGGSGSNSSSNQSGSSGSGSGSSSSKAAGPTDLGANLKGLMARAQPQLSDVKISCPAGAPSHFPVQCNFTATSAGTGLPKYYVLTNGKRVKPKVPNTALGRKLSHRHAVIGTIKVLGIYSRTNTYEYALDYRAA